ncbi:unnamed protein product [Gulo gulo]|uniref:Uncharacterized protein n=1 Tax=Gulo gulo TaxID=48420 RepID=A0A9X9PZR7_GULGU|nr:unnamed protein product [Gulo gulo]
MCVSWCVVSVMHDTVGGCVSKDPQKCVTVSAGVGNVGSTVTTCECPVLCCINVSGGAVWGAPCVPL